MFNKIIRKLNTLVNLYLLWVAMGVGTLIWSLFSGEYQELMSLAVSKVEPLPEGVPHEAMLMGFIVISLVFTIIMFLFGFLLVVLANKGKRWAQWLFLIFCVWRVYDEISAPFQLDKMYPDMIGMDEWIFAFFMMSIFVILTVKTFRLIRVK